MATSPESGRGIGDRLSRGPGCVLVFVVGLVALAVLGVLLVIPFFTQSRAAAPQAGVTLDDLVEDPEAFVGETATVSGVVDHILLPHAFVLRSEQFAGHEVLVVAEAEQLPTDPERPAQFALLPNDLVEVTGRVDVFDIAAFEEEVGEDVDDELFAEFVGGPMITALSVRIITPPTR